MFAHISSSIGVVTDTFYPGFEDGYQADTMRGNLALSMAEAAQKKGFPTIVVDGGSSTAFVSALKKTGATVVSQKEKGMSKGRQQGYAKLFSNPQIEICVRLEAEKFSFIEDEGLDACIQPILECSCKAVVPFRSKKSLATYPPFQVQSETLANAIYCDALSTYGLLAAGGQLDVFFGPRVFHRSVLPYFMHRHVFHPSSKDEARFIINPGGYSDALYYPLVHLLHEGKRIQSIDVNYSHPPEQTAFETDNSHFDEKRISQRHAIIAEHWELLRMLHGEPSALTLAS